jgi:hypothetical protein
MTVELVSNGGGKTFRMSPRTFGKLLHIARFNGWWPERVSQDWPSGTWNTELILPHIGPYMPGPVSPTDASSLVYALNKANATGELAAEPSLHFASLALVQLARAGGFDVRFSEAAVVAVA